jgi:hypothetical protein
MLFTCKNCHKSIDYYEPLYFCPFCGASFQDVKETTASDTLAKTVLSEDLVSSMSYSYSNKEKYISSITSSLRSHIDFTKYLAQRLVDYKVPKFESFDFSQAYDNIIEHSDKGTFFLGIHKLLDSLSKMNAEENNSFVTDIDLADLRHVIAEGDKFVEDWINRYTDSFSLAPLEDLTITTTCEVKRLDADKCSLIMLKIKELATKIERVVKENNIIFSEYGVEFPIDESLGRKIGPLTKDEEIISLLGDDYVKLSEKISETLAKDYSFDLLDEGPQVDEMMYVFWNAVSRYCHYVKRRASYRYIVNGEDSDSPEKLLSAVLDSHYEPALRRTSELEIVLRQNNIESLNIDAYDINQDSTELISRLRQQYDDKARWIYNSSKFIYFEFQKQNSDF